MSDPHPLSDPTPTPDQASPGESTYSTDAALRPRDVRRLALQALYTLDAGHAQPDADVQRAPRKPSTAREARAALKERQDAQNAHDAKAGQADLGVPAEEAPDPEALLEALEEPFDEGESIIPVEPKIPAVELAIAAWATRHEADAQCSKLAPDWPTARQPPIDRAILRLAWFEMTTGRTDATLAIHEAVELAKQFSDEKSPPFINGVLDRVAKRLPDHLQPTDTPPDATEPSGGSDPWLSDAVES